MSRHTLTVSLSIILSHALLASPALSEEAIDRALAVSYFKQAQAASDVDGGKLWGKTLYGPMMFVDRVTRSIVANQPDALKKLSREGDVFVGELPAEVNMANTAMDWAGKKWTMIMWPLPDDESRRQQLMAHEMWHRIQESIGLAAGNPANNHLDSRDGRVWLQLEWRALVKALESKKKVRSKAIGDAISFRRYRQSLFAIARNEENALEMNEGLAEYTGVLLSGRPRSAQVEQVILQLTNAPEKSTFVRSFAYASGPAYGLLLHDVSPDWAKHISRNDDLASLLAKAWSLTDYSNVEADAIRRAKKYGFKKLSRSEDERLRLHEEKLAKLRLRFIDGPTLMLPMRQPNISFNPNSLIPLDDAGTVYPTLKLSDKWGILEVSDGALIASNWRQAVVSAPNSVSSLPLSGSGWILTLKDGFYIAETKKKGSYEIRQRE